MLGRVEALLAEGGVDDLTRPEAETFSAGAQALMASHSIDAALLAADTEDRRRAQGCACGIRGALRVGRR